MTYAKLISGNLSIAPNPILHENTWIGNPPGTVYEAEGYKPVVYADDPGDAPSGFQWSEIWSEDDFNIQQGWVLVEIPISEEDALVRYANELTGANDTTLQEATETLIKQLKED